MLGLYFLGFFAAGQGLFQTFLISKGIKHRSKDQILLGLILTFLSLSVLEYSLVWSQNIPVFPHLIGFSTVAQFLFLPFIYMFFVVSKGDKLNYLPLHFILFGLVLFTCKDFLFLSGQEKLLEIQKIYSNDIMIGMIKMPICIIFSLQCIVYFFLIKFIKNRKQGILSKVMYRILMVYILIHLFHTKLIYFFPAYIAKIGIGILLFSIIAIYVLSYYSYKRNEIIKEEKLPKYYHSTLDKKTALTIITQLNTFLKKENYFTNADIRIAKIAQQIKVPKQHLSQAINQELNCSFRDYLNRLRIGYAEELIVNEKTEKVSLKEIAYSAGFNNKTSFANAFKKKNKMTPSQYVASSDQK